MAKSNESPRTMVRGHFAGQRFETRQDYWKALRATSGNRKVKRYKRKPEAVRIQQDRQPSVRAIVDAYEELRAEGIGAAKAARLVERLVLGR